MAKTKEKDTTKQELNVVSSQPLIYSGNVKIEVRDKFNHVVQTIERHNLGTEYLFRFLLNCLAGNYYKNQRPRFFYLIYTDGDSVKYATAAGVPLSIANIIQDDDGNYCISYQVSIPIYRSGTTFSGLVVYSYENNIYVNTSGTITDDYNKNYSMRVDFENSVSVEEETNLLITWQLTIQDKNE